MFIEVKDQTVEIKAGTAKKTGQPYEMFEQNAYLHTEDEKRRIVVPLRKGQQPYAPGRYRVSDESFVVGDFNTLAIGRLMLVPMTMQPAKSA